MPTDFSSVPQSGQVWGGITPRNIFTSNAPSLQRYIPSFYIVDGDLSRDTGNSPASVLRTGLLLGKITTSGKYRPAVIGVSQAAASSSATSVTVTAAVATEVARLIADAGASVGLKLIGPPSAAGTVAILTLTVSAASGTTLTCTALSAAAAAGSLIAPGDGAQYPRTILAPDTYSNTDVTTRGGANQDAALQQYLIAGDLLAAQIVNLTADDGGQAVDASCQAWLKTQLRANGGQFTFDNDR